jgi:alpha-glucosidase
VTLRGTPTIYYGDEIGLAQVPIPPDRIRDPLKRNVPGLNLSRDGARTPMQWSTKSYAGFSNSEPWLPLTTDWPARNVEILREDSGSIYGLYRRLIETRGGSEVLKRGSYHPIAAKGDMLIYVRAFDAERILIVLNLGATPVVSASLGRERRLSSRSSSKRQSANYDRSRTLSSSPPRHLQRCVVLRSLAAPD